MNKLCTSVGCLRREPQIVVNIKFVFHPCGIPIGVTTIITLVTPRYITESTNITTRPGTFSIFVEQQPDGTSINFGVSLYF